MQGQQIGGFVFATHKIFIPTGYILVTGAQSMTVHRSCAKIAPFGNWSSRHKISVFIEVEIEIKNSSANIRKWVTLSISKDRILGKCLSISPQTRMISDIKFKVLRLWIWVCRGICIRSSNKILIWKIWCVERVLSRGIEFASCCMKIRQ